MSESPQQAADRASWSGVGSTRIERVVEALVFASDEAIGARRIADIFSEVTGAARPSDEEITHAVDTLNTRYDAEDRPLRIEQWGGGFRMATVPDVAPFVKALFEREQIRRLSRSLMETLAILAYRQPVTKPEVDFVRGVDSDYAVRRLLELGLVDVRGRADSVGRPLLYATTDRFLELFGLNTLDDLPNLREVESILDDPSFHRERALLLMRAGGLKEPADQADTESLQPGPDARRRTSRGTKKAMPDRRHSKSDGGPKGKRGRSRSKDAGRHAARRRARSGSSAALPEEQETGDQPMRLNRYIARSGACSRREADEWIVAGKVQVNEKVVTELGSRVQPGDTVVANGRRVSPRRSAYVLLNKPKDTITTKEDERGRRTILDLIDLPGPEKDALFPVGRLDRDTTGVLLVMSDGDLAHRLMHPSYEIEKLYRVRTTSDVTDDQLRQLVEGVELEDGPARADRVELVAPPDRTNVGLSLHEGRNRQVRRMFEALGHRVRELERVQYAGLTTRGLRRGTWRRLTEKEVSRLHKMVKLK